MPDEFVLKKYIVALVTAPNILLCKFVEAFVQIDTNVADLIKVAIIIEKVKIANTITQLCRGIDHDASVKNDSTGTNVLFAVDISFSLR